jgi:dolichol-phosphate mannosyltransferase
MRTLTIIPTYDERENIETLIAQIQAQPLETDILVVDDRSPDGTGAIVTDLGSRDPRIRLLSSESREGYGRSVVRGFKYALENGYDRVVTMDADLSHDPKYLPDLIKAGADVVVGSRYTCGISVVNWPLRRVLLSVCANRYVRFVTGLPLSDCTTGYRVIRRTVLEAIGVDSIRSNGYSFISEVNYRAHRKGFRLVEVPIIFIERRKGGSKMSLKVMIEAVWMPWRLRLGSLGEQGTSPP